MILASDKKRLRDKSAKKRAEAEKRKAMEESERRSGAERLEVDAKTTNEEVVRLLAELGVIGEAEEGSEGVGRGDRAKVCLLVSFNAFRVCGI